MSWFEDLTGFAERSNDDTRSKLAVEGEVLVSRIDGRRHGIGRFEMPSLGELRQRAARVLRPAPSRVRNVRADVQQLHLDPTYTNALFQVASQFNMLEMVAPLVQPEHGVTRYEHDFTQGPACAIAAGAATIYRNCFVPVGGGIGQAHDRQLDGLADVGAALSAATGLPPAALWEMRNGYALAHADGLAAIAHHLQAATPEAAQVLRDRLRIGVHWGAEVTLRGPGGPTVSQIFCSALPMAYCRHPQELWEPLARLVLEAAYEATLHAAAINSAERGSNVVALTLLGGGAFGNPAEWIVSAMRRALRLTANSGLDVRLVSYSAIPAALRAIEIEFA